MDTPIKKQTNRFLPLFSIIVLIGFITAYFVWMRPSSNEGRANGDHLLLSTVEKGLYEDFIPLRVNIEPYRTTYLDAVEGGRVEDVYVEEGDMVKKGQNLLLLSNTALQLDLISREAQVSEQLNNLRNTKLAIERNRLSLKRELIELDYEIKRTERQLSRREKLGNLVSAEKLEGLQDEFEYLKQRRDVTKESQIQEEALRLSQLKQLENNVHQLDKNLEIARKNLDNLLIKAPRSGRLTSFDLDIGETRTRGERLGQIDDVDQFKVSGMVSEFYLNKLTLGLQAETDINGKTFTLELSKIYPEVANNEFKIDLRFLENTPSTVRRGQTLTPRLTLSDRTEAHVVDNGAFIQDTGGKWVYVLNPTDNTLRKRQIQVGRRNPNKIEILDGLSEGETIITSSYTNFNDADLIRLEVSQ